MEWALVQRGLYTAQHEDIALFVSSVRSLGTYACMVMRADGVILKEGYYYPRLGLAMRAAERAATGRGVTFADPPEQRDCCDTEEGAQHAFVCEQWTGAV